jgi:hypothetical protein
MLQRGIIGTKKFARWQTARGREEHGQIEVVGSRVRPEHYKQPHRAAPGVVDRRSFDSFALSVVLLERF